MLFYEKLTEMPDELRKDLLECPHYVVTAEQLAAARQKSANITIRAAFEQLSLPHIMFTISLAPRKNPANELSEAYLIVFEGADGDIQFTYEARFTFTNSTYFIRGIWSLAKGGVKVESHNIPPGGESPEDAEHLSGAIDELSRSAMEVILSFDILLRDRETREAVERRTVKAEKSVKGKKAYRDVTIVHLASRKDIESGAPGVRRDLVWSHSWAVRGHWRKYDGIGKNRAGERTEVGRTWVIPFEKQTHLETRHKVRVIK